VQRGTSQAGQAGVPAGSSGNNTLKGLLTGVGVFVAALCLLAFIDCIALNAGADSSTAKLAKQVQSDMVEHFRKDGVTFNVKEDLMLVNNGGNAYTGVMTVAIDGKTAVVSVNVISDGETVIWKIEE
jgi:hypothetical protein